ncbi:hypothetical protein DFQ28_007640 [Apophysomyces sp. BC1034]|nr:hypothetical protein DFQ30_007488 [Apophysomyces sp. BC1015]KAG0176163.1 hypothetical protein DFQ29_006485 [Apophysomyces sp. BC1021]KAG0186541.1 hypothetical protein DFQ28_007640 [Apophysomyces sp. BC1034]
MNNLDTLEWILQNDPSQCDDSTAAPLNIPLPPFSSDILELILGDGSSLCTVPNANHVGSQSTAALTSGPSFTTENSLTATRLSDEEAISETELKLMTSKERRQLRNKISARNFRNRRKEYMTTLEEQVEKYKAENSQLKLEIKWVRSTMERMQKENDQLRLDLLLCREGIQSRQSTTPSFPCSSSDSSNLSSSSPEMSITPRDTYLAHATMPDWDVHRIVKETTALPTNNLLSRYPLLAPALMSIVLDHAVTMAADDLLANAKLNASTSAPQGLLMDHILPGPKYGTSKRLICTEKQIRALWTQQHITTFVEPEVGWIQAHCPFYWVQRQFCRFVITYLIVRYPQLESPATTYLPVCERFRRRTITA